jgi:hypothetical protein
MTVTIRTSSFPATQVHRLKRPLSPSCVLPAKMKHPRNLAYPLADPQTQTQASKPLGSSKQAVSKRKMNEQVLNGTFIHNLKQWNEYKQKLAELDPNFEVSEDPRLACQAKHSVCGGWFVMAAPYDKERFKNHVASCSYSSDGSRMMSLENFGIVALSASTRSPSSASSLASSPAPNSNLLLCPGIADKDCASIGQYLSRTCVASAGGKDIHLVARSLFSDEFKNLSSEKKELVRLKQRNTHTWSIDHLMKTIHAIGRTPCESNAEVTGDGSVRACKACQALLMSQAFKKAVSRKPAPDKN